jgi:hypothetical protein
MTRQPLFALLDHCCSICGGRVLHRVLSNGFQQVRCAECGASAEASPNARAPYEALCFCGVKLATGADAGLRCRRAVKTPERPQEVVVAHVPPEQDRGKARTGPRPVRLPESD